MTIDQIEKLILLLSAAKKRPAMFFPYTMDGLQGFMGGLHSIYSLVLDMPADEAITTEVLQDRGWRPRNALGPLSEMQEKGIGFAEMIDEIMSIELEVLKRMKEKLF